SRLDSSSFFSLSTSNSRMPYYAPSAYCSLPSTPQPAAPRAQQQYAQPQQQYGGSPAPQADQAYLRQQAQQQAYQQQHQLQQQQYLEQQNRQLAQQQYYQQQQQQQYAQQQQQQQYAQQQYGQQQAYSQPQQQYQQQRSGYQQSAALQQSPARPQYKSSDYIPSGGVYSTGGAYNQPSLRRVPSRASVNTAIENEEAPYQAYAGQYGQGLDEQQRGRVQYNAYANYGQAVQQSPLRPQRASQREPSEYAYDALNQYKQPSAQPLQRAFSQEPNQTTAREVPSASNVWIGARAANAPTTVVLDGNNNSSLPSRPRSFSPAPQRNYGQNGAQPESAYIAIPNDLVYAQNNQQRAYTYATESRPVYAASSSRSNQAAAAPAPFQLKPAAARELYAALSSENVRTALERDLPVIQQTPAYSTYNGQRVQGHAFAVPANQKYSEYQLDDLNSLRSVIDR
ncbi:hypothetical protein PFISCL1PPCAC_24128, partial [Pristionchus fissidentatus]